MAVRKGIITFGLVSIPVELHVAARSLGIAANLLHAECQTRIRQQWLCPTCDRVVQRGELVRGYPVDGRYVILTDEELDQLEEASSRAVDVVEFVDVAQVNPLYLEASYYVTPQKDAERPYEVLREALAQARKAAVVRFVSAGRQHHGIVRADADVLVLHTLYYADEVRPAEATWKRPAPLPEEIRFAREFVEALGRDFDAAKYHDEYRERLAALIQARAAGEAAPVPAAAPPPPKVVNLVEALRQSVERIAKPPARAEAAAPAAPKGRAERAGRGRRAGGRGRAA